MAPNTTPRLAPGFIWYSRTQPRCPNVTGVCRCRYHHRYTVKLKEEFNQEMIAQEQRNKKSMHMVQDKARADEQKLIDKNFKQMADLTSRYEREKQQLVQKMEEQHKIELGRMEKMWGVRCEVSQAAVNTLNNEALAASVVERQERILAKVSPRISLWRVPCGPCPSPSTARARTHTRTRACARGTTTTVKKTPLHSLKGLALFIC